MARAKRKRKDYCFDLDGTLCTNTGGDYTQAVPYPQRITELNALAAAGHRAVIYTARGSKTGIDWTKLTRRQLAAWKVKYNALYMGKPFADIYVDDKSVAADDWFKSGPTPAGRRAKK